MTYIPKRVIYDEFPEEGYFGITNRQALEAAIDGLIPAYHLIFSSVTLYEYTRGATDPLTRDFKKWGGLTLKVPLGVLYTLNFYPEHSFIDSDGKPSGVLISGPLGTPGMRPDVPECNDYLLWPEAGPITFDRSRLFFLREDLEALAGGTSLPPASSSHTSAAAGQQILEIQQPSHLLLIAALMELLKKPRQTSLLQEGIKGQLLEQFDWRGLSKRTIEKMFADANRAAAEANKTSR